MSVPSFLFPPHGSTQPGTQLPLAWRANGFAATRWWVYVGTSAGGAQLLDSGQISVPDQRAWLLTGLPNDGSTMYVTLFYRNGTGTWSEITSVFISGPIASVPPSGALSRSPPYITCMAAVGSLVSQRLTVGDTVAVATKGQSAHATMTALARGLAQLPQQIETLLDWIELYADETDQAPPVTAVALADEERGSSAYNAAITGTVVNETLFAIGRRLVLSGIVSAGRGASTDTFMIERVDGGALRWAGPLLPVPDETPAILPTVDAGADTAILLGGVVSRTAAVSVDPRGALVSVRWTRGGTVLSETAVLNYTPSTIGEEIVLVTAIDDTGRAARDALRITIASATVDPPSAYELAAQPNGVQSQIATGTSGLTRTIASGARSVWTANGNNIVVATGTQGTTAHTAHAVLNTSGGVVLADSRVEREAMGTRTDANALIGGWHAPQSGEQLTRSKPWPNRAIEFIYKPTGGELEIGDGRGRPSNDDRWLVIRTPSNARLVVLDVLAGTVTASMSVPAGHQWASITPDGAWVLVGETGGVYRYARALTGRTQLSSESATGDAQLGADGRCYFVQGGATPRLHDVADATSVVIAGGAASGDVSGVCGVPGYVAACWRVGGAHQLVSMNIADGTAMWTDRVVWAELPAAVESRAWAQPVAVPSPDGRRIVYRKAPVPNSGTVNLYIAS